MTDQVKIICADCMDPAAGLPSLPDNCVQCVVTSPPYWGLRDYGIDGQLGLEPTPDEYVAHLVAVFREVRRVLRDDGTVWLNLGDSYAGAGRAGTNPEYHKRHTMFGRSGHDPGCFGLPSAIPDGLKAKDIVGIPWRVAFALQAEGWWLRSAIIWAKPNPMPESVTDRPTSSYEHVFLLASSQKYFWDQEAVREPSASTTLSHVARAEARALDNPVDHLVCRPPAGGRNLRDVRTIPTQPFPGAHFAVFPEALVKPCVMAGTSEAGACPDCGAPWERIPDEQNTLATDGDKDHALG